MVRPTGSCIWALAALVALAGCAGIDGDIDGNNQSIEPGSTVGAPCRAEDHPDGPCVQDLNGIDAIDLICVSGTCLPACDEANGGDFLCGGLIDSSLTCATITGSCLPVCVEGACSEGFSCFATDNACLPTGAFPGSPCRSNDAECPEGCGDGEVCFGGACVTPCDQNVGGVEGANMNCIADQCLIDCREGGTELCQAVNPTLACSGAAGGACVPACVEGQCGEGFSCFSREETCLPTGAFPTSPCRQTNPACDQNLGGVEEADMICVSDQCVIDCSAGGEAVCQGVDASLTCSAAAGALCLPQCGSDGSCDPGFSCFDSENACLPTGAFPTSPCRPISGDECDSVGPLEMVCLSGQCILDCADEGTEACEQIQAGLVCSQSLGGICLPGCASESDCDDGFSCFTNDGACAPTGSFPGSPCRPDPDDPCDRNLSGIDDADMICVTGTCVIDCIKGGTELCKSINPTLQCSAAAGTVCLPECVDGACSDGFSCFTNENSCLPTGAFPGSPCVEGACGMLGELQMECVSDTCVVPCSGEGDPTCPGVDASLACSAAAGSCVPACVEGNCPGGFSCFSNEGNCLPTGAFPGSPCNEGACGTLGELQMECVQDTCVVPCAAAGDPTCPGVDPSLACSEAAGSCVPACIEGACPAGFSCFSNEDNCLPTGAFPGSPCVEGACGALSNDADPANPIQMACVSDTCVVPCEAGDAGDALCGAVDASLQCSAAAGACVPACVEGACPGGFSCFATENSCLPTGSFPGSPCAGGACAMLGELQMACVQDTCVVPCAGADDPTCPGVDPSLACSEAAGSCVPACVGGACPADFSCFATEDNCLPTGSFPGSPCLAGDVCGALPNAADPDSPIQMACVMSTCVVPCEAGAAGDALCGAVDASLQCSAAAGACVPACVTGVCPTDFACFATENSCLPLGTFPGGPCTNEGACAPLSNPADPDNPIPMSCASDTCVVPCDDAAGGDQLCAAIDSGLVCSATATICVPGCVGGACPPGYTCFNPEDACLPD